MKRLLFALFIFAAFATPSLARDAIEIDRYFTHYAKADGRAIYEGSCVNRNSVLTAITLSLLRPDKKPKAYLIRWTARPDGAWRKMNKPNTAIAGNQRIRHKDISIFHGSRMIRFGPTDMAIPAGQPVKVMIRPVYGKKPGAKTTFTTNSPEYIAQINRDCTVQH